MSNWVPLNSLRIVLKDGSEYAVLLGAKLYENGELFCSTPAPGGGELARSSYHRVGVTVGHRLGLRHADKKWRPPSSDLDEPILLASWSGALDNLKWGSYDSKWDLPQSDTLLIHREQFLMGFPWAAEIWALPNDHPSSAELKQLRLKNSGVRILKELRLSEFQPNLFAIVWMLTSAPAISDLDREETAIVRNPEGDLVLAYQGESHWRNGTPYEQVCLARSADFGRTWTANGIVANTGYEDVTSPAIFRDIVDRTDVIFRRRSDSDTTLANIEIDR